MAYLPRVSQQFSEKEYWDTFFLKRGNNAFEWYGQYTDLSPLLQKYVLHSNKLLVVGCGNSQLSAHLYDEGYYHITNIDISEIIIKQMRAKNLLKRPKMIWETMDILHIQYEDESFDVVLDKGTLDALMVDNTDAVCSKIDKMFKEVQRVLKPGGRFICVTLLQSHILHFVLNWFGSEGWLIRFHRCIEAENLTENSSNRIIFPVFVLVCTKLKKMPGLNSILELSLENTTPQRVVDHLKVCEAVQALQHYAFIRHQLSKGNSAINKDTFLELYTPDSDDPRYKLHIVDSSKKSQRKFAVFVVPQGRETEWLFSTAEGHAHLAENASWQRLVVVHLNRNHVYENLDTVKKELSSKIMQLAPQDLKPNAAVPFLSIGDDLGMRTVLCNSHSESSGDFVIEDVESENKEVFRRLIFKNNPNVIQSEAKIKIGKKKGKIKRTIDHSYLACNHHQYMLASLAFIFECLEAKTLANIFVIGLGGGSLPMYIYTHFPKFSITVVEIDPEMARIAKEWFGFVHGDRMKLCIQDGLKMITDLSKSDEKFDLILLDADSKDNLAGLSVPPQEFVEEQKLQEMKALLTNNGVCVINLVSRNVTMKQSVLTVIKKVFPAVYAYQVEDEVNELIFCLLKTIDFNASGDIKLRVQYLNRIEKRFSGEANNELELLFSKLKVV